MSEVFSSIRRLTPTIVFFCLTFNFPHAYDNKEIDAHFPKRHLKSIESTLNFSQKASDINRFDAQLPQKASDNKEIDAQHSQKASDINRIDAQLSQKASDINRI